MSPEKLRFPITNKYHEKLLKSPGKTSKNPRNSNTSLRASLIASNWNSRFNTRLSEAKYSSLSNRITIRVMLLFCFQSMDIL